MKKVIIFILIGTILSTQSVFATTYDIKCLNAEGKFSDCKVTVDAEVLKVEYKSKKLQEFNKEISGKNISAGEYSRRRVGEAVATGIFTFGLGAFLLASKKKRDQIGLEYIDSENKSHATAFELKKKYGLAFKAELKALSGKEIVETDSKK